MVCVLLLSLIRCIANCSSAPNSWSISFGLSTYLESKQGIRRYLFKFRVQIFDNIIQLKKGAKDIIIIQGKLFGQKGCVCTIMAFIMFLFIHFILKFRDSCKDYYSRLVVHSQFKFTLSPVLVQAFLSQSICLLTNNSKCKFTFLFFLCLTYTFAQTHKSIQPFS